jgi:hypothetical protein
MELYKHIMACSVMTCGIGTSKDKDKLESFCRSWKARYGILRLDEIKSYDSDVGDGFLVLVNDDIDGLYYKLSDLGIEYIKFRKLL